jgi:V8-like Glu-specific endopeptidase
MRSLLLSAIVGLFFSLPYSAHSATYPLDRQDPKAQLSEDLKHVVESPTPVYKKLPPSIYADQGVSFDINTRQESKLPKSPDQEASPSPPSSGTLTNSLRSKIVIGPDDRQLITPTVDYPWRAITKLYMTFPNGKKFICSGVLIAPKYILSAGHCVYDADEGGWATLIEVIPGLDGTYKPYGSTYATTLRSYSGWTQDGNSDFDISLITLASPIGSTVGWFGYTSYPNPLNYMANIAGYPGDRDNGTRMYYHAGPIFDFAQYFVSYLIDTAGGQSGSGVYHIEGNGDRYAFAAHTYGHQDEQYNSGTRITPTRSNDFTAWIATDN